MSQVPPAGAPQAAGQLAQPMAALQRLQGVVVMQGRAAAVVEIADRRVGLEGAPPLRPAARVTLETSGELRPVPQPARLVAVDGRMLETPLSVRLRPVAGAETRPTAEPPRPPAWKPPGLPVELRLIDPGGRSSEILLQARRMRTGPAVPTASRHASSDSGPAVGSPAAPAHRMPAAEPASAARLLQAIQSARPDPSRRSRPGEAVPDRAAAAAASSAGEMGTEPFRQSQAGGWRLLLVPLGAGPADGLRLYLREDPSDREGSASEAEPETPRRAVFELDLSHLGRCQLDVFCQGRRFDLVVRSERSFDAPLESEIRALHQAVVDATGWFGAIRLRPELLAMPGPEQPLGALVTA